MIRRVAIALIAALVAFPSSPAGAEPHTSVQVRKVNTSDWPRVSVTVSTPGVDPEDIRVEENGLPVTDLDVRSLDEVGGKVDVVLAIDTSDSMKGAPLARAVKAATNFVEAVPDEVRVGLVTFSDEPLVAVPLTTDRAEVVRALEAVATERGTTLYDAVDLATQLFTENAQRNIVLLSDGADTSSSTSLEDAQSAVEKANVTVFAVGLKSGRFDAHPMQELAVASDGRYAPVATADLTKAYKGLATQFANQFVIKYSSVGEADAQAAVEVFTPTGADRVLILAPPVKSKNPRPGDPTPGEPKGFQLPSLDGAIGLAVVLFLTFICVLGLTTLVFGAHLQTRRTRSLARRMGAKVVQSTETVEEAVSGPVGWIPDSVVNVASAVATRGRFGASLDNRLERAGISMSAAEFIAASVLAAGAGAVVGLVLAQGPVFAVLTAAIGGLVPHVLLTISLKRRLGKLQAQLADILMILASSLRAGHSFLQALNSVAQEVGGPGGQEFGRVVAEIRLGRSPEEALNDLAHRIDSDDFKWAVLAVNIQRESGGNLAEVLDTIADTMRERETVRRQVNVLAAEGKISIGILTALPFFVASYMALVNPKYLGLLMSTGIGRVMLITGSCLLAVGIFWMRRVVKVHV